MSTPRRRKAQAGAPVAETRSNHTTLHKYDPFGELIQTTDLLNQVTKDAFRNRITGTDALGNKT